jgi:signal transduction histidine kinase
MALAFAVVGLAIFIVEIVDYVQATRTRAAIETIQKHALQSVELTHRIGDDIHNERLLLDRHVFEHEAAKMVPIERQIQELRADYEDAARSYASLITPAEATAWHALTSGVAEARRRTGPMLVLSRADRDEEAIRALKDLDLRYEKIAQDEDNLDRINQEAANSAVDDVRRVQMTSLDLRLGLLATVLLTVLLVGGWSTRSALRGQQQLATANETLAERNRDLDAFAGRLAHDLRGPLTTIGLTSSVLADRFPDARLTTAIMDRSVTQIANLIDELLTLSRVGAMPGATAQAEAVATSVGQRLEPIVTGAGGTLRVDLQAAAIACSEGLLVQVLWNLGENAVKYRRPDLPPALSIDGAPDGGRYRIRVVDNGLGMTEADTRRAIEPFYRGERTRKIAGTGLGLAIVHRIVEVCHGTIAIESRLGQGTTFTVSMPLAA